MRAVFNGTTVAESSDTVVVEGNHYFPASALDMQYFEASSTHTICGWKGQASYYTVRVGDQVAEDAAWYYPDPKEAANHVKDRVAFWKGVKVVE
ncbi:MAG: DUF427 domain-containing protein [Polyangiaceae bacterium]